MTAATLASPPPYVEDLLQSLSYQINNQPANIEKEISVCNCFLTLLRSDKCPISLEKRLVGALLESIATNRIGNASWYGSRPPRRWASPLVEIARILAREKTAVAAFHRLQLHHNFCDYLIKLYLSHQSFLEFVQLISALLSLLQKLCNNKENTETFADNELHKTCLQLLSSKDLMLLHGTLHVLGLLSDWSRTSRVDLCQSNAIDVCLQLTTNSDHLTQKLCVSLLRILCCEEEAREQVKIYDGVPLLVGFLSVRSSRLQWHVSWSLAQLCEDHEVAVEVAQLGAIPLLLAELETDNPPCRGVNDWLSMLTGFCALLAQLCQVDANQLAIVHGNGIYVLGKSLLLQRFPQLAENGQLPTFQCSVFRVLRLLFSLERNRHFFKRVFEADFFEDFIDIGHYVQDLSAYKPLVQKYKDFVMSKSYEELESVWQAVNQKRAPIGVVGDFELVEQLGAGAFGCVYTVRKVQGEGLNAPAQYFALKEIYMVQPEQENSDKSFGDIISEVRIIKQQVFQFPKTKREQLRHPNIVRYRRIFVENHKLYIVMDLIEGASLKEHINSVREKKETFPEARVWNILIQLILALRYLHKEKRIVHRDLKPNNIMLSDNDRVVITDFGLAKEKGADYLKSAAGTILYSCPEIVQNLPYGEKADIWSLGCCLYEICNLRPPFYSQNMLLLATRIVEATYDPISKDYSEELRNIATSCLVSDPANRPDILGVAQLATHKLLLCLDDIFRVHASMTAVAAAKTIATKREATGSASLTSSLSSNTSTALPRPLVRVQSKPVLLPQIANNIDKQKAAPKAHSAGSNVQSRLLMSTSLPKIVNPAPRTMLVRAAIPVETTFSNPASIRRATSSSAVVDGTAVVTVRTGSLRPIADPNNFKQAHRIVLITTSPSADPLNHKRRLVEQFKRRLFGPESNAASIKKHLRKLAMESPEEIDLELGYSDFRPALADVHIPGFQIDQKVTRISYDQLAACIAILLKDLKISSK